MPAWKRGSVTPDPEELSRLIDDYADGQLDAAQLRKLVDLLGSSAEARDRVAPAAVVERLLQALRRGPVSPQQIMRAVAAQASGALAADGPGEPGTQRRAAAKKEEKAARTGPRRQLKPVPSGPSAERSPWRALAALAIVGLLAGVSLWRKPSAMPPADVAPAPAQPASTGPGPERPAQEDAVAQPPATPNIPPAVYRAFPLEPPPPPQDEDLSPPKGDGSDEPGFVAPPAAWIEEAARRGQDKAAARAPDGATQPPAAAQPPLLWVKIRPGPQGRPDATPDDLPYLLQAIRQTLSVHAGMAERAIDAINPDPGANPILYLTGYYHFEFSRDQRIALRKFMLSGGMLIFDAGLGSKPFYDSARRELRLIFPDVTIERLSADHPIYHAYYDLDRVSYGPGVRRTGYAETAPWFDGITISCRAAAVISRWGLGAGWQGKATEAFSAYGPDDARRLGINLFSYATATRAWAKRAASNATFTQAELSRSGKMCVAQVMYSGEWQTRYAALPMLLHSFNQRTDVPVNLIVKPMRLTDPEIFNAPLLYMTGHLGATLAPEEIDKLAQYLRNGGFLFAEACCGRSSFDRSFRALMSRVLPGQPLTPVPPDAPLLLTPNRIESVSATPSLGAKHKSMLIRPRLEGIKLGTGYVVVYSPYGLAGGWEMSQMPYADGYEDADAIKLGQNILNYAITQ